MGARSGKRGPDPLPAEELARRGSHRAGRRAAEERGEITRRQFVQRPSPPRERVPGDEFAWGDPRRDSLETWLPLLLLIPKWDPRVQGAGYRFDGRLARRVIGWFERHVRHLTGPQRGQLVRLDPWQRSLLANAFGWVVDGGSRDGLRRFRKVLLYLGKKNGKTSLVGGLAAYAFTRLKEGGAKVFTAATHRGQARGVWEVARDTIEADPRTLKLCIVWNASIQKIRDRTAELEPISGEATGEDGKDCFFSILDELHRQNDTKLLTVLDGGGAARQEPMFWMLTTADEIRESPCNAEREYAVSVRSNVGDPDAAGWDPSYLPAVYELDEDDAWDDERCWGKANPGLGTIKSWESMRALARAAKQRADARIDFQRLHLNLRVQNVLAPINAAKWAACRGPIDWRELPERMRGRPCWLGVDLAHVLDMIALVAWFPEDRVVIPAYWACEKAAQTRARRNEPLYFRWRDLGALEIIPGDALDLVPVMAKVVEWASLFDVKGAGVDRAKALELTFAMQNAGIHSEFVGQGWISMTEPCDRLIVMLEQQLLQHGGHPVLNWNAENLRFKLSGQRGKQPHKPSEAAKIDGISAWLTAMATEITLALKPTPQPSAMFIPFDGEDPSAAAQATA